MGLLDDAIREHLELKRRRGADPGEVAQQQREALDVPDDAPSAEEPHGAGEAFEEHPLDVGEDITASEDLPVAASGETPYEEQPGREEPQVSEMPAHRSALGEETAELDMQTVLDEPSARSPADPAFSEPVEPSEPGEDLGQEPPGAGEDPAQLAAEDLPDIPPEIPGQERMPFE